MSRKPSGYGNRHMPPAVCRWTTLFALAVSAPVFALEGNVGFGAGSQYSDNVTLSPKGAEQSAWMGVGSASLQVGDRSEDHEVRAAATLDYVDYFSGPFNNDFLLGMSGNGNWALGTNTKWYADDYFNQMTINALAAPVPTNRQDVNVLSTGPEARLPINVDTTLVAGGRYENFWFAKSDTSSQRLGAYGRWLYAMSPRMDLSANVESSATDFKSRTFPDFRRTDLFLRLGTRFPRASVELDGGKTLIQRDHTSDVTGTLARLGWHLPFNTHHGIDFYVTHEYTDVGTDILDTAARPNAVGINNVAEQITGSVFYNRQSELVYHWQGMFSSFRLAGGLRDEDYKTAGFNRHYEEGGIGYGYDLNEAMRLNLDGSYTRAEYHIVNQVNTDRAGILSLIYKINHHLSANFQVSHTKRDSSFAPAAFEENRYFVSIGYNQTANPQRLPGTVSQDGFAPVRATVPTGAPATSGSISGVDTSNAPATPGGGTAPAATSTGGQ